MGDVALHHDISCPTSLPLYVGSISDNVDLIALVQMIYVFF